MKSKNFVFYAAIIMIVFCCDCKRFDPFESFNVIKAGMLDNCEDGNDLNLLGGLWSVYDDSADNGSSLISPKPFHMQGTGVGGSNYAAKITGYVTKKFAYGYAGLTMDLNRSSLDADMSQVTMLRFYYKGDGNDYRVFLRSPNAYPAQGDKNDMYGVEFTASADWQRFECPFSNFTQSGYGTVITIGEALMKVKSICWQTVGHPLSSFELWVDDIEVY